MSPNEKYAGFVVWLFGFYCLVVRGLHLRLHCRSQIKKTPRLNARRITVSSGGVYLPSTASTIAQNCFAISFELAAVAPDIE